MKKLRSISIALIVWLAMALPCAASTMIYRGVVGIQGVSGISNGVIAVPPTVKDGHLIEICFWIHSGTPSIATFGSGGGNAWVTDQNGKWGSISAGCAHKIASGEPSTYTPTWATTSATSGGVIFDVYNTDNSNPVVDASAINLQFGSPALTTLTANDQVLTIFMGNAFLNLTTGANTFGGVLGDNCAGAGSGDYSIHWAGMPNAGAVPAISGVSACSAANTITVSIAYKSNATTAALFDGMGMPQYNNGTATDVYPSVPLTSVAGDWLYASLETNVYVNTWSPVNFNGTYAGSGVTYGAATLINTDAHTAVTFDGTAGQATSAAVPIALNNTATNGQTIEVWFKVAGSTKGALVKLGNGSSGWGIGIGNADWDGSGLHLLGLREGLAWVTFSGVPNLIAGTTYHGVAEMNGSTNFKVWLNGTSYTGSSAGVVAPTGLMGVGGYSARFLAATEQKAAIYSYLLSTTQIANHYLAGTTAPSGYAGAGVTGGATYDAVVQNDNPTVFWPLGESSSSGGAVNKGTTGISWTQIGSTTADPTNSGNSAIYRGKAIGTGFAGAQFHQSASSTLSEGEIVGFHNLDATTPDDTSFTVANAGESVSSIAPLLTPQPKDELAVSFNAYPSCGPLSRQDGQLTTPILQKSQGMSIYYETVPQAMVSQMIDQCGGPIVTTTLGLKAATTPAAISAALRMQFMIEEYFSLTAATSPPPAGGSEVEEEIISREDVSQLFAKLY